MTEPAPIRVLIADDDALVRKGVRWMLEGADGIEVAGEVSTGSEAVEASLRLRPSVVVMDVRMSGLDGITATRRLLGAAGPDAPNILFLTAFAFEQTVFDALRAGATGFLLKDTEPARLIDAVRTVARGEALLDPAVTQRLIKHYVARPRVHLARRGELVDLTEREVELLTLLARGLSNAELSERMQLSEATVKSHLTRVFTKLKLKSRTQAVALAYETGLVEPGSPRRP